MTDCLDLDIAGGVARLSFNNPRRLNAINAGMWRGLPQLLARVRDDAAIRVLLLQGAGDRAFCTGNDVSEFDTVRADGRAAAEYNALQREVADLLHQMEKPAIAAVHGYCLGAGFEFALMCDLRIATLDASFGVPAVKLGLPYRFEDIEKVVAVVGLARAREMVLLGRRYTGADIARLGLAQFVVADRVELAVLATQLATELAANAPLSLAAAKIAFRELEKCDGPPDLARLGAWADRCYLSRDYAEGRAARREKRQPMFEGR